MLIVMLISILVGAVLGMRFKVVILVPGVAFGLFAVTAAGLAHRDSLGTVALVMVLIATGLQLGYLFGTATRFVVAGARPAPAGRRAGFADGALGLNISDSPFRGAPIHPPSDAARGAGADDE
jgi:hypothetical protein